MTQSDVASESSHNKEELLKEPKRFPNLRTAGLELAVQLETHRHEPKLVVLGIALGGMPVAREVAHYLGAPLDVLIIRRLLAPDGPNSQICAVSVAGELVLDERLELVPTPSTPFEHFLVEALAQLNEREKTCRKGQAPLTLTGRTVLLVDCGIRTGSTMTEALKGLRKVEPNRVVVAVPVASREGYAIIANLCDDFICLSRPEQFVNAGYWYSDFRRPGDDEVGDLLV